jgi:hypothetical protein
MAKVVNIYKVDYEISNRPNENWIAYIAAYSSDEARNYLDSFVHGGRVIVNTMSNESRLDAVTDEVRKVIAQPILGEQPKKEEEKPKKEQKKSIVPK